VQADTSKNSRLFELARVLVRLDQVASFIVNANRCKGGWSLDCMSAVDFNGRTIWIADAHGDGKRFVVRVDES